MAQNILTGQIIITAPNVAKTSIQVSQATDKMAKSLQRVAPASNAASLSLVNLGRVVQDAPFGFLGIANNLNPLVESFQRLKAQTGTTGGALKALGKDLLGAGGLGFAISLVSTGLILFGDRLFGASKAAKAAADESDKFKKAVEGIFASTAKEAAEVTTLVAVLRSETETRDRKLAAIKELQSIQPDIFNNLKLEGSLVTGLDTAYKNYLDNLRTVIAVKIKQAQLEGLIERQLKAQGVTLTKSEKAFQGGIEQVKEFRKQRALAAGQKDPFSKDAAEAKKLQSDIDGLIKSIEELSKGVEITPLKPEADKSSQIIARAKKIFDAYKDIIDLRLNILPEDEVKVQLQKAQIFLDKFFKQQFKFVVPIQVRIDEKDVIRPKEFIPAATTMAQMFGREFNAYFEGGQFDPSIFNAMIDWAKDERIRQAGKDLAKSFSDSLSAGIIGGLSAIGEGLGNVLSGKDFGAGIINVIGDLITQLGKALLAYGAIKQGIDKLLGPGGFAVPGGVAIGLGIAAIAIGQAFKNFGGFRAAGGAVEAGKSYIVGEKGAEMFVPNTGGRIIPNNRIGNMGNMGGMQNITVTVVQRGKDLVGSFTLAELFQRRNA